jgi:hypothetical protein
LFYPLNYGERGQYSDDAHVESAAEQSARSRRGLPQRGLFFRNCPIRNHADVSKQWRGFAGGRGIPFHSDWG